MKDLTAVMIYPLRGKITIELPNEGTEAQKFVNRMEKYGYTVDEYRVDGNTHREFEVSRGSRDNALSLLRTLYTGGVFEYRDYPRSDGERFIACADACREARGSDCECNCNGKFHSLGSMHNEWERNVGKLKYGISYTTVTRWHPPFSEILACELHEKDWWWPDGRLKSRDGRRPEEV